MPSLHGSYFGQTITYLCEHNEEGALGLIINREVEDVQLGEVFDQLDVDGPYHREDRVLEGGPVQRDRGFVLHADDDPPEGALRLPDGLALSTSREILADIAAGRGPERFIVCVGYAGWDAGQLESELGENSWLTLPADDAILFDTPLDQRIDRAAGKLGIDFNLISGVAGHA